MLAGLFSASILALLPSHEHPHLSYDGKACRSTLPSYRNLLGGSADRLLEVVGLGDAHRDQPAEHAVDPGAERMVPRQYARKSRACRLLTFGCISHPVIAKNDG